jgi:hypothetical protein
MYDFQLRRSPETRASSVRSFYRAIDKGPGDVFPLKFSANVQALDGILAGRLHGFYSFPLDRPSEICRGEQFLDAGTD